MSQRNLFARFGGMLTLFCLIVVSAWGQTNDEVLFTVADQPVTTSEFKYVYEKNNPGKQNDYSKESLDEYLELYVNFKLKVQEAKTLRIDTLPNVRSELVRYKNQLVKSYFDKEVTEKLMVRMHERMKKEIDVNHIMIQISKEPNSIDTLEAWNKINDIRNRVLGGMDFAEAAKTYSHDPMVVENSGNLGFITGLQVPDERFEDGVFETPIGGISKIVRTNFGYHIIKPGSERPASGTVTVAHILFRIPKDGGDEAVAKTKAGAEDVYKMLVDGASFDSLALKYSDDKITARKGGRLTPFGIGKMVATFEDASFSLKKDGDYTKPVKTEFGYHIIKRLARKEVGNYEEVKQEINKSLQRTGRYQRNRLKFIEQAKGQYNFTDYPEALSGFIARVDSSILKNRWEATEASGLDRPLIKMSTSLFTQQDFAEFTEKTQRAYTSRDIENKVKRLYNQFVEDNVIEFALGQRHEDFRRLMQEYRDGILLFELTEEMVWSRALRDTIGLRQYYDTHKTDYMWGERKRAYIYECSDAAVAKKVRKYVSKGKSLESIDAKVNKDDTNPVLTIDEGIYSAGQNDQVDAVAPGNDLGDNILGSDGTVTFVQILDILEPAPKPLNEAKGYVISDYQDFLEKEWISELKKKYKVDVKKDVFKSLIKKQ